jgi:type II secretory pathway component PulC
MSGFEISRIKKEGIIGNLGLRDGDLILEANGHALDSLATVLRLAGEARNARRLELTVLRAGKIVHFIYDRK